MIDAIYSLLRSIGYDDPLHPPMTHFPIGLTAGAFLFLLVAILLKKKQLEPSARHAAILAFIFVFPTILFGVLDWIHFYRAVLMPAIVVKMVLSGVVILSLGAVVLFGGKAKLHNAWLALLLALAFIAMIGLGYFGAGIIYGRNVSMAKPAATSAAPAVGAGTQGAPSQGMSAAISPNSPEFARGRDLFAANCAGCHVNGRNVIVASLPVKTSTKLASLGTFSAFVRSPSMPDGSAGQMPAYDSSALTDKQLADIYDYAANAWK